MKRAISIFSVIFSICCTHSFGSGEPNWNLKSLCEAIPYIEMPQNATVFDETQPQYLVENSICDSVISPLLYSYLIQYDNVMFGWPDIKERMWLNPIGRIKIGNNTYLLAWTVWWLNTAVYLIDITDTSLFYPPLLMIVGGNRSAFKTFRYEDSTIRIRSTDLSEEYLFEDRFSLEDGIRLIGSDTIAIGEMEYKSAHEILRKFISFK